MNEHDHTDPAERPRSETMKYLLDQFVGDDPGRRAAYERELAEARAEMEGPARTEHEFTLTIPASGSLDFAGIEALMDAVAGIDATVAVMGGRTRLSFTREAATRDEAIASAIRDVARAGFRTEIDDAGEVTQS